MYNNFYNPYPTDNRIFVQGEVGAKAYLVAPNNTVCLWDSESPTIYLKTVNQAGIPAIQRLQYTIDEPKKETFITREEFDSRFNELMEKINVSKSNANDSGIQSV